MNADDPSYWLDHFNGDGQLAALVVGGLTRRKCDWCERELRPCNLGRHIQAAHFRQLTIWEVIDAVQIEVPQKTPNPTPGGTHDDRVSPKSAGRSAAVAVAAAASGGR